MPQSFRRRQKLCQYHGVGQRSRGETGARRAGPRRHGRAGDRCPLRRSLATQPYLLPSRRPFADRPFLYGRFPIHAVSTTFRRPRQRRNLKAQAPVRGAVGKIRRSFRRYRYRPRYRTLRRRFFFFFRPAVEPDNAHDNKGQDPAACQNRRKNEKRCYEKQDSSLARHVTSPLAAWGPWGRPPC